MPPSYTFRRTNDTCLRPPAARLVVWQRSRREPSSGEPSGEPSHREPSGEPSHSATREGECADVKESA